MHPFRFAVQSAIAPSMSAWRAQARMAEDLGYSALYLTDHVDTQFGPLVAATIAAESTTALHVGSLVLNNDLRNPVALAKEIATLAMAAEGRVEVGLGAGWLRSDYEKAGVEYDGAGTRIDRLSESLTIMRALWEDGEATFEGTHYSVRGARCEPRPELLPKIIVGGGSKRILELAAKHANIVNVSVPAGTETGDTAGKASLDRFDRCIDWVRSAAGDRFDSLELQVVVSAVMVVKSQKAASRSATMLGFPGEDALDLPVLLLGTEDEFCDRLLERRERWGFSNIVVPVESMHAFAPVVSRLAGS